MPGSPVLLVEDEGAHVTANGPPSGRGEAINSGREFVEYFAPKPRTPTLLELMTYYGSTSRLWILCNFIDIDLPSPRHAGRNRRDEFSEVHIPVHGASNLSALYGLSQLEGRP